MLILELTQSSTGTVVTLRIYSDEQITDIRRGLTSLRPQVMEGLSTRGEARLWWMAA